MSATLTSWKEIAQYLNKGTRTVQRWERDMGLPVRRPNGRAKGVVFAFAEEIDHWLQQQSAEQRRNLRQELEKLRAALAEAMAENQALRIELESSLEKGRQRTPTNATSEQDIVQRATRLVLDSAAAARMYAETIEVSRNLRMIRNGLK